MNVTPFARKIKQLRAERGLTVRDLASAIGKSVAYIAKIEVQGEIPTPELVCTIAQVLETSSVELLNLAKDSKLTKATRAIDREFLSILAEQEKMEEEHTALSTQDGGGKSMTTVLSMINMKGGVGKTTLAMHLAHTADSMNLKTLAVDLDPQSNLSQALMGSKAYVDYITAKKPTVVQIFDDYFPTDSSSNSPQLLDVNKLIVKKAGYWRDTTLDLIPSRLELSRTLKNPTGKERRLAKALARIKESYDLVIIDCAPTESVLTDAAYFASRYVIVPIKPEFMATIGLPLLARSLTEFQLENDDHKIDIAGIVFNHSSTYSAGPEGQKSIKDVTKVAKENNWYVCENQVKYSASYAKSARENAPLSQTSYQCCPAKQP